MQFSRVLATALLGAAIGWLSVGCANYGADAPSSRQTMDELASGLATALGASLDPDRLREEALGEALEQLADGSQDLLAHGGELGQSTEALRSAMAREAGDALADFHAGRMDGARRRVHQLVDQCFACHTRLPESDDSVFGGLITQGVNLKSLELREQVFFLVATRQFDAALAAIESALGSSTAPRLPAWIFEAYLKLSIRVHGSYGRARDALQDFLERSSPAPHLAARMRSWVQDLESLERRGELPPNLASARTLIDEGRQRNEFPADRRGLVYFTAASGLLARFLDGHDGGERAEAEAFYLLGVAESHISTSVWIDQTGFFLERAIRLRPHSPLAERAYALLAEYETARNSGASGLFLPDSVSRRLESLASLAGPEASRQ